MTMPLFSSPLSNRSTGASVDQSIEKVIRSVADVLVKLGIAALRSGAHQGYNEAARNTVQECYNSCQKIQQPTTAPGSDAGGRTLNGP